MLSDQFNENLSEASLRERIPEIVNSCEVASNWAYFCGDVYGRDHYENCYKDFTESSEYKKVRAILHRCYSGALSLDFFKELLSRMNKKDAWEIISEVRDAENSPVGIAIMSGNLEMLKYLDEMYQQHPEKSLHTMMQHLSTDEDIETYFGSARCKPEVREFFNVMHSRYVGHKQKNDGNDYDNNSLQAEVKPDTTSKLQMRAMGINDLSFLEFADDENGYSNSEFNQLKRKVDLSFILQRILEKEPAGLPDFLQFCQKIHKKYTNETQKENL